MGSAEFDLDNGHIFINAHLVTYGHAADPELTSRIREEIETMWNEPQMAVRYRERDLRLRFCITAEYRPDLDPQEIFDNTDERYNYIRIEKFAQGNISFVDGVGSNTGYWLLENLYAGSTTAAHEFGHMIGLHHPVDLDLRGRGIPGIMYPRGTLVDAPFQYNPEGRAGDSNNGGTMHPMHRRVLPEDIHLLKLHRLDPQHTMLGEFTSIWHPDHAELEGPDPGAF